MFSKSTLLLIVCATLNWNLHYCSPLTPVIQSGDINESNNIVNIRDDVDANLTNAVNSINDVLLKASQLIILNNLDKKVDGIIAHLEANNVANMLKDFKEELLLELKKTSTCHHNATVQSLLGSSRNCRIKNRRFPEYFYAAEGYDKDSERRRVFTWIPGYHDYQCLWDLERFTGETQSKRKYKIKSVKYGEYLYAGADDLKYDEQRREIFTWKPKTYCEEQCYWDIQLVKQEIETTEQYFTIRNTEYGEYFYAVDGALYDVDRRRAFTWKFDPNHDVQNDHQSHWIIKCE